MPTLSYFTSQGGLIPERHQQEVDPCSKPEWRKTAHTQRWSEVKKLLDHIETVAQTKQERIGRAVSRMETARELEEQRRVAKKGKEMGLTTFMRQLR